MALPPRGEAFLFIDLFRKEEEKEAGGNDGLVVLATEAADGDAIAVLESATAVVAASDAVRLFEGATVKVAERYAVRLFNSTVGEYIANRYVACIFYHSVLLDVTDGYVA